MRHQSDSLYKVVDALNPHVTLLSTIYTYVLGFNTFYKTYSGNASFGQIYTELMEEGKQDNYMLLNAYLFHGLRLCVPVFFFFFCKSISFMNCIVRGILDRIRLGSSIHRLLA